MGGSFVEVNGTRLYVEVAGMEDAPAVIFVHGFSLDTRTWDRQVDAFSEQYRIVRYDLRGFGRSSVPEQGVHYQHQSDLRALLDTLSIDRAAVIGQSLGGAVALDFVLQHPDRVSALVTVGSVMPGFDTPELAALSREIWAAGRTSGVEAASALLVDCALFNVANERPASRAVVREIVADYSGWHWTNRDPEMWADPNCEARLGQIAPPTLIVIGERELHDMRQVADALVAGVPDARKVVLPGLGHLPNMEDAEAFNAVVLEFLNTHA
jgi:pimeloyl-ACP methyl ester carboxylesterase